MQIPPATPLSSSSPLLGPVWPLLGGWWGGGVGTLHFSPSAPGAVVLGCQGLGLLRGVHLSVSIRDPVLLPSVQEVLI